MDRRGPSSFVAALLVAAALAACSSGGGGGGGPQTPQGPPRYKVGGTVTGLTGTGLVLQDNGGDDLAVGANGAFTFATNLLESAAYAVTVKTHPLGQLCTVSGGAGNVARADVISISVTCAAASFRLGGRVTGLTAPGLVLQDNGADDLALDADGVFTFATPLPNLASFAVTLKTVPANLHCSIAPASGTLSGGDFSGLLVTCSQTSAVVSGTVSGIGRAGLVIQNNGGDDLALDVDGAFTFATSVADGSPYLVSVKTDPPASRCTVANGSGTIAGADVSVTVTCHGWTLPAPAETGSGNVSAPAIAFDPATGDAFAVWIQVDGGTNTTHVWSARRLAADGSWTAAVRLDTGAGDASAPEVGADGLDPAVYPANASALAVWSQKDGAGKSHVWASQFAKQAGTWGTPQQLDTSSASVSSPPRLGIDLLGSALVVWTQRGSGGADTGFENVWYARYDAPILGGSGWAAPIRLDTSNAGDASAPRVTLDTASIGFAAWLQSDGTRLSAWGARWLNSARFTGGNAPVLLEADTTGALELELAEDQAGNAIAVWKQPEPAAPTLTRVWASRFDHAGTAWSTPVRLEAGATSMRFPAVGLDETSSPSGFAVWRVDGSPAIHASRYDEPTGTWGAAAVIGGGVADPGSAQLCVGGNASGNALAFWYDGARVRSNHYSAGVGWNGEIVDITPAASASTPVARFGPGGDALGLWIERNGSGRDQLMSAAFR